MEFGIWGELLLLALLIVLNAFFAATETALVSARRSRLRQLAAEGLVPQSAVDEHPLMPAADVMRDAQHRRRPRLGRQPGRAGAAGRDRRREDVPDQQDGESHARHRRGLLHALRVPSG